MLSRRLLGGLAALSCLATTGCGWIALIGTGAAAAASSGGSSGGSGTLAQATIATVTPNAASHGGGASITITGTSFSADGLVVLFGDRQAQIQQVVSSQEIRVGLPALSRGGATTVKVSSNAALPAELLGGFTATNALPTLSVDPIPQGQSGNVAVRVQIVDADGQGGIRDTCDLDVEFDIGSGFVPVTAGMVVGGASSMQNIQTNAAAPGFAHVFVVDTKQIIPNGNATMRLRVTPVDTFDAANLSRAARSGPAAVSNAFTVNNNSAPILTLVSSPTEDDNVVPLTFQVSDPDPASTVRLTRAAFTNLQTGIKQNATPAASSPTTIGAAVPKDVNRVFQWDSRADLGFGNGALILFELEISDGTNSVVKQFSPPFFVDNGPFEATQTLNTTRQSGHAEVADVTSDGVLDLALSMTNASELQLYENDGAGNFTKKVAAYSTDAADPGRVRCGPLAVIPIRDGTGARKPTVFCIDIADVASGVTATSVDLAGNFPEPLTVISHAQLTAAFPNARAKVMLHGDFSDPPDGLDDLVVLLRDGNGRFDGGPNDPGSGTGQLVVFQQMATGGLSTMGQLLLPAPVSLGVAMTGGLARTVDQQPGDFNVRDGDGDGDLEMVVAETGLDQVRVYTQTANASVSLVLSATIPVSVVGQSLVTADLGDFNGDGRPDVIALTSGPAASTILVYLANPVGGFAMMPSHQASIARRVDDLRAINVTRAVDKDVRDDVVVGDTTTTNVGVFVSAANDLVANPSGFLERMGAPVEIAFPAGSPVTSIALGDFNRDGNLDVASAAPFSNVPILRIAVPRQFLDAVPISIQNSATTLAAGDVLGNDGADEVLAVDSATKDLLVLGNDPVLVLAARRFSPFRCDQRVKTIDFDGDGKKDDIIHLVPRVGGRLIGLAIIPSDSADLVAARPSATSSFIDPETIPPTDPRVLQVISSTATLTTTIVFVGGSRFVFFNQEVADGDDRGFASAFAAGIAFGDVGRGDADPGPGTAPLTPAGLRDIVVSPGVGGAAAGVGDDEAGLFVLYGDPSGTYTKAVQVLGPPTHPGRSGTFDDSIGGYASIEVADLNSDSRLSILGIPIEGDQPPDVTGAIKNALVVLDQDAAGVGLAASFGYDVGNLQNGLVFVGMVDVADFDADGFVDVCLSSNLGPTCNILVNRGAPGLVNGGLTATFQGARELPSDPRPVQPSVGDLDGDGKRDDVIMTTLGVGALMVYTGNGDGTFDVGRPLRTPEPFWCTVGDVNGDGKLDAISSARGTGTLSVFRHK